MGDPLRIEITGTEKTRELVKRYADRLSGPVLSNGVDKAVMFLVGQVRLNSPVDTGRYRNSVTGVTTVTQNVTGNVATGIVGTNVKYAFGLEHGTRPHTPDIQSVTVWAERKGLPPGAIIHSIRAHGTKGQKIFTNTLAKHRNQVQAILNDAIYENLR